MPDIINLLPDHIANQIAAGEVIQRPASAVKEMLENAVDAGATQIHLIVKDAGKELIKVIDNGKGMSATDARMCFERHATSKIKNINDLFQIRTMGFRGEALASIAAVAQVELKTKLHTDEAGTYIQIESSEVKRQEPTGMSNGTSLAVKNLFYNVPARRNFLKSNTTELKNIVDEFTRVAMAFPAVAFKLSNNDTDVFNLESGNLKQRIVALLGNQFQSKLVGAQQRTNYINITGFVGTPQAATKTRGNQYFFVNNRFIKSAYLNHAVSMAYQGLIAKEEFPAFVLFLEIDPEKVDANVHPTKQEIKFEDEKTVYAFVNSTVKHALSTHSLGPAINFDVDPSIAALDSITQPFTSSTQAATRNDYLFQSFTEKGKAHFIEKKNDATNWKELYQIVPQVQNTFAPAPELLPSDDSLAPSHARDVAYSNTLQEHSQVQLLFGQYILYPKQKGLMLIDAKAALERIAYDNLNRATAAHDIVTQQLLHPVTYEASAQDAILLQEMQADLAAMGFVVEAFGQNTFIVQGIPATATAGQEEEMLEQLLELYKHSATDTKLPQQEKILRTMAWQHAARTNLNMPSDALREVCVQLFQSSMPTTSPRGKRIIADLSLLDIEKKFLSNKAE